MKQRATDPSDHITRDEAKAARIPWYKALKLFILNLPVIAKVVMLVIGLWGGTMAAPEVYEKLSALTAEDPPPPLPIPAGITVVPETITVNPEVRQSLASMNAAINAHTGALKAIREDIRQLEERREASSERDDAALEARIVGLEGFHD